MSSILNLRLAALMSLLAITLSGGCGGSDTAVDPWVAPPADYYKPLGDNTSTTKSTFGGVGIRDSEEVVQASGTLVHNTGALTFDDGLYNLEALAGFDDSGVASGADGSLLDRSSAYAGTYEYVMPVEFIYEVSGINYTTQGFAGIMTDAAHVPVSGSATYTGDAAGQLISDDPFSFGDWISTIIVDFGAGSANVTLESGLGASATDPIDTVQITGMTVAGNTFTGGELATLFEGVTVTPIGAITYTDSLGMFFGWDNANLIPDEVGGVSLVVGDGGRMLFLFVGD